MMATTAQRLAALEAAGATQKAWNTAVNGRLAKLEPLPAAIAALRDQWADQEVRISDLSDRIADLEPMPPPVDPPVTPPNTNLALSGFGAFALDGLGAGLYEITSTAAGTGAGTLRGALAWLNAGNTGTVKFMASGTFVLPNAVQYVNGRSNFLIDGRGQSVTMTGGTIWIENCHHFALVNVRHRGGWSAGQSADNITITQSCHDYALVNVSVSGSFDEGISSTANCSNFSLLDCLFGPGGDSAHNYGSLNYGYTAGMNGPGSFARNAWIGKDYRNPKLAYRSDSGPLMTTPDPGPITYDVVNNVTVDCTWPVSAEQGAKVNNVNPYDLRCENTPPEWAGGAFGTFPVPLWAQVTALSPDAAAAYAKVNAGCLPHDAFDTSLLAALP